MNGTSVISVERVKQYRQNRFSPIRGLTPEVLSRQMDDFAAGYLRSFALTMDAIERRDYILKNVAGKRKKAVARRTWTVEMLPGLKRGEETIAKKHKEALEYFYNNLRVSNAVDRNEKGGVSLLVRQIMDCIGKQYAVHEIVWKANGDGLTAEMNFVPLWFFENRTGSLRFLPHDGALDGLPLEEGAWMVSCGDGLMEACAVAYMFKQLPLKDWLIYCEKHGMPGVQGKCAAPKDSDQWKAMVEAVAAISRDFSCVTSIEDVIEKIDLSTEGQLPYPPLVEEMNRAMASLWRGADLSTISAGAGQGQGASLQGEESKILENDDARFVSEVCRGNLDRLVIAYAFGPDTKPLAFFQVAPEREDASDLQFRRDIWKAFAQDATVNDIMANLTSLKELTEQVGLPVNEEYEDPWLPVHDDAGAPLTGEVVKDSEGDIIGAEAGEAPNAQGAEGGRPSGPSLPGGSRNGGPEKEVDAPIANEAGDVPEDLVQNALAQALGVAPQWLAPVRAKMNLLLDAARDPSINDERLLEFVEAAAAAIPELFAGMDHKALADALEAGMGTAALNGLREKLQQERTETGI